MKKNLDSQMCKTNTFTNSNPLSILPIVPARCSHGVMRYDGISAKTQHRKR